MKPKLSVHPKGPNSLFERAYRKVVFSAKDYGAKELDALFYGIVVGYEPNDIEVQQEIVEQFGWTKEEFEAIYSLHEQFINLQHLTWA